VKLEGFNQRIFVFAWKQTAEKSSYFNEKNYSNAFENFHIPPSFPRIKYSKK
jgi:hypothetical protein